jgi:hypothetical protein
MDFLAQGKTNAFFQDVPHLPTFCTISKEIALMEEFLVNPLHAYLAAIFQSESVFCRMSRAKRRLLTYQ